MICNSFIMLSLTCFSLSMHTMDTLMQNEFYYYLNPQRKNKRRQRMDNTSQTSDTLHTNSNVFDNIVDDDNDIEVRPVRRRDRVEAGLDYWIDESDLKRDKEKRIALKNRKVCR